MNGTSNNKQLDVCIIKVEHIKKLLIKNINLIAINITYNHPAPQCLILMVLQQKCLGKLQGVREIFVNVYIKNKLLCISEPCILYYF